MAGEDARPPRRRYAVGSTAKRASAGPAILLDRDVLHPAHRRPAAAGLQHGSDLGFVTAEDRLDRAVAAIAHPPGKPAPGHLALDEHAIADALDEPGDGDVDGTLWAMAETEIVRERIE